VTGSGHTVMASSELTAFMLQEPIQIVTVTTDNSIWSFIRSIIRLSVAAMS
jgi:hypothetical protein